MFKIIKSFYENTFTEELEAAVKEGYKICSFQSTESGYVALLEKNTDKSHVSAKINSSKESIDLLSPVEKANVCAQRTLQEEVQRYFREGS